MSTAANVAAVAPSYGHPGLDRDVAV